jgi:hypothetical protein
MLIGGRLPGQAVRAARSVAAVMAQFKSGRVCAARCKGGKAGRAKRESEALEQQGVDQHNGSKLPSHAHYACKPPCHRQSFSWHVSFNIQLGIPAAMEKMHSDVRRQGCQALNVADGLHLGAAKTLNGKT